MIYNLIVKVPSPVTNKEIFIVAIFELHNIVYTNYNLNIFIIDHIIHIN